MTTLNDPRDTTIRKKAKATASTSETKLSRTEKEPTAGLEVQMAVETIAKTGTPAGLVVRLARKKAINGRSATVIRNGNRERNKTSLVLAEI